jgi:AcrR family transcriptional regulator
MSPAPARKLPRAERRDQLLDTALAIVREEGTDALTLGHVAGRAGVSKPIAYEHFGTRSGLLIALYERIDDRQVAALLQALERTPRRLEDIARVMSDAYITCYLTCGPEAHAITAALSGDGQMEAFHQRLLDRYVAFYQEALAPYSSLSPDALHLRCIGLIGAAEAISRDMLRGRVDAARATETLAALIVGGLAKA